MIIRVDECRGIDERLELMQLGLKGPPDVLHGFRRPLHQKTHHVWRQQRPSLFLFSFFVLLTYRVLVVLALHGVSLVYDVLLNVKR